MSRPSSGPAMGFVCRACRNSLMRPQHTAQWRSFSSTPRNDNRALPVFRPTSSSELDTLLSDIRLKYFLPRYLNDQQRKLVQSKKLKSQLENDPVYGTFGDEEIQLHHLDVTKDVPPKSTFLEVIRLSTNKADWENLPGLLEGYHRSKAKMDSRWLVRVIDAAKDAGVMHIILQCLSQVEKNGFSLADGSVRAHTLLALRATARDKKWSSKSLEKSLKQTEQVLYHMEHPKHCGSRKVTDEDPRAEPYVVAVPLELAARQAVAAGQDASGKVEMYSTRLIAVLAQQTTPLASNDAWKISSTITRPLKIKEALAELDMLMTKYIVVRNALLLTQQIRDSTWAKDERAFASHLQKQIEQKLDVGAREIERLANSADYQVATPGLDEWRKQAS